MHGIAASLNDDGMRAAASYYAALPARDGDRSDQPSRLARGAAVASRGIPDRDVPACVECQGPTDRPKNPTYPRLAGQHTGYLEQQLRLLQGRRRGGTENVRLMHVFVDRLRTEELRDVTLYYGSGAPPLSTTYRPR